MINLITANLDIWSAAVNAKTNGAGRSSGNKGAYGINKLRELILELAVRGKLVPQDPNDEPASELLNKIHMEKDKLTAETKQKKAKPLPSIMEEEKSFELPYGWEWVRLGDVLSVINGRAYKKSEMLSEGTPLLRVGNLFTSNEWYYSDLKLEPEKYIDSGDLIFAWSASFGPFIWDGGKVIYHYHIWKLEFYDPESLYMQYVYNYLLSVTKRIKESGSGIAMIHMTKERMEKLVMQIPPLREQHRIVAKVDELMALCDQLEAEQADSVDAHAKLVSILLEALTQGDNLPESWARLREHFDVLATTPSSIDKLKQTLLQLAVMGRLVPQDPSDEPASELLKKIRKEKDKLILERKIKKVKPLPPITEEEKPFELPNGWEWVRFYDYAVDIATGPFGSMLHKADYVKGGIPLINPSHMINDQIFPDMDISVSPIMAKELESYSLSEGDIVMARRGEVGRIALVTKRESGWLCGTGSFVLRFGNEIFRDYLRVLFRCESVRSYLGGEAVGMTMVNLNHGILKKMPFALPPRSEQRRIVAKVDELTALCDQLKALLVEAGEQQRKLADVMVEIAVA